MIRKSSTADIEAIMKIWLNTNMSAHSFIPAEYWSGNYDAVKEAILTSEVYVFEEDGIILGFVGVLDRFIAGLFVEKTFQRKNIGTALIEHLKLCKTQLSLKVYIQNESAVNFYKKQGFIIEREDFDNIVNQREYVMIWKSNKCKI